MCYLAYLLYIRGAVLWEGRNLPSVRHNATKSLVLQLIYCVVSWTNNDPDGAFAHAVFR